MRISITISMSPPDVILFTLNYTDWLYVLPDTMLVHLVIVFNIVELQTLACNFVRLFD